MKSLKQFINLFEKITKQEINKALASPRIRIGAEFEYIDSHLESHATERGSTMDSIIADYDLLRRNMREAIENRDGVYNEFIDEVNTLQAEKRDGAEKIYNEKIAERDAIDENEDEWNRLDAEATELYLRVDEITNMEREELWNEFESEDWNDVLWERQSEYYVNIDMYSDLVEWWKDIMGKSDDDIQEAIDSYILEDYPRSFDELGDPNSWVDETETEIDFENEAEDIMDDDFPFNERPVFGEYHANEGDFTFWKVESDASLDTGGVEIISPIMTLKYALNIIPQMFSYIEDNGFTNHSTGFHITLSKEGTILKDNIDLMKLMLFFDEGFIIKNFPNRQSIDYSQSMLKKLGELRGIDTSDKQISFTGMEPRNQRALFKKFIKYIPSAQKYNAINWTGLWDGEGRIEIRWMGGGNYHKKWDIVRATIGRYVHYMNLALDPEYHKEEYVKKLMRLQANSENVLVGPDKLAVKASTKKLKQLWKEGELVGSYQKRGSGSNKTYFFIAHKKMVYRLLSKMWQGIPDDLLSKPLDPDVYDIVDEIKLPVFIKNLGRGKYPGIELNPAYKVK